MRLDQQDDAMPIHLPSEARSSAQLGSLRHVTSLLSRAAGKLGQTLYWALPVSLALLAAALLKAYYVATSDPLIVTWRENRWIQLALVVYEMALAFFLLSGWYSPIGRWLGLATFLVYFEVALYEALVSARPRCSCFGALDISPWWAVLIDAASVLILISWHPAYRAVTRSQWLRLGVVGAATVVPIVLVAYTILDYAPRGIIAELRRDERLNGYLDLFKRGATGIDVVEAVQKATGVSLSWHSRLPVETVDMGYLHLRNARPWSLMELLAKSMPEPVRWRKVGEGYYLAPASPFAAKGPFYYLGAFVMLTACALCAWPPKEIVNVQSLDYNDGATPR